VKIFVLDQNIRIFLSQIEKM